SLLQHHLDKVSIYLHSDRSITPLMQARFWSTFPGSVVIGDGEADDRANEKLSAFPSLRALRHSGKLGWAAIKAIDPFLWGNSDHVYFMDTDVIVVGELSEIFDDDNDAAWSRDTWWSLDRPLESIVPRYCSGPVPQLNTGIGKVRRAKFNPETLEFYLGEKEGIKNDQILLGLVSANGRWTLLDEDQYMTASEPGVRNVKAKHYTTPFRALYWEEGIPVAARALKMPLPRWLSLRP